MRCSTISFSRGILAYRPNMWYAAETESTYETARYRICGDHIEITGCIPRTRGLVIPAVIDGLPVTTIREGAFQEIGIRRVYPDAEIQVFPIADGGEGAVNALVSGLHLRCDRLAEEARDIPSGG